MIHPAWLAHPPSEPPTEPVPAQPGSGNEEPTIGILARPTPPEDEPTTRSNHPVDVGDRAAETTGDQTDETTGDQPVAAEHDQPGDAAGDQPGTSGRVDAGSLSPRARRRRAIASPRRCGRHGRTHMLAGGDLASAGRPSRRGGPAAIPVSTPSGARPT
ncbi:hypothetical protein NKG94_41450 [Micromonospora sp. M12]